MNQQPVYTGLTGYDDAFLELLEKKVKLEDIAANVCMLKN
jgi:hypothetical protein